MKDGGVTVLILTFNEALHIARCVESVRALATRIVVIDSFSTDETVAIAQRAGCEVVQHPFRTQADQLRWALERIDIETEWTMRIDADEVISSELVRNIRDALVTARPTTGGLQLARTVRFQNQVIRHGGFPYWQLRVWRTGAAHVESRWMDEHMVLDRGDAVRVEGVYLDDNLNDLSWWIDKHNGYASREAADVLLRKHEGLRPEGELDRGLPFEVRVKRVLKERIYLRLPPGQRASWLFLYRMLVRQGFRDGLKGLPFHLLQGLWYRYVVDLKVRAVENRMRDEGISCREAIRRELHLDLDG